RSELFSYWPMRIHLKPASNMRVHHQRFHGRYGSRGRAEVIPNPSRIWEDRFAGAWSGTRRASWALEGALRVTDRQINAKQSEKASRMRDEKKYRTMIFLSSNFQTTAISNRKKAGVQGGMRTIHLPHSLVSKE